MNSSLFRFILLTAMSAGASAQIALVHVTSCGLQVFPAACAIPATGAGNLIVVGFQMGGGVSTSTSVAGVSDNSGNIYAEAISARAVDNAAGSVADFWYAGNSLPGATSLTISPGASVPHAGAVVWEFSGVAAIAPLDQATALNSQPPGSNISIAGVTTTSASGVVVAMTVVAGNVTGLVPGSSFISDSSLKGNGWAHLMTSAPGTFLPAWSQNPAGTFASATVSFKGASGSALNACDLNADGMVDVVDVQAATNMYLGLRPCTANIAGPGICNPLVVQQVDNAALTGTCLAAVNHTVSLTWSASTTAGVNYNVYRSSTAGGPYVKLNASPVSATAYVDSTALHGQTYYYVTTAVASGNIESSNSNEALATIPFP